MSVIHIPYRVDWDVFLATFPKPGDWIRKCRRQLRFDHDGFARAQVTIYREIRPKLPAATARALDLLLAATALDGLPKRGGHDTSSLYVPRGKYRKADFEFGADGHVIPRSSPDQVAAILDALAAADLAAATAAVKAAWGKLEPKVSYFEAPAEFAAHVKNWARILEEIRDHRGGLAIDLA